MQHQKNEKHQIHNVLIEFGYALKRLGLSRIILVINEKYGDETKLPFDLHKKRIIKYKLSDSASHVDRFNQRKNLEERLTTALSSIFQDIAKQKSDEIDAENKVTILKKNILDESKIIIVDELIRAEVEKVRRVAEPEDEKWLNKELTQDELISLMNDYESASNDLEQMMAVMGQYAPDFHRHHLSDALESLSNLPLDSSYYYESRKNICFYPALRVLYVAGISALYLNNYENLRSLLIDPIYRGGSNNISLIHRLNANKVMDRGIGQMIPGREGMHTPLSDYLEESLKMTLLPIFTSEAAYRKTFDQFEYFIALTVHNYRIEDFKTFGVPIGCFVLRQGSRAIPELLDRAEKEKENWAPIKAGFFNSSYERFLEINKEVQSTINRFGWT